MNEFDLIAHYFSDIGKKNVEGLRLGIGDDCAILNPPSGQELCVSVDTLVEGVHFPENIHPYALGWRALAVALSDLAAMAAQPAYFTIALTLNKRQPDWLSQFSLGLSDLAEKQGCSLVGGDTTRGPLTVSVQVFGWIAKGAGVKRSGAKTGDLVCVSGKLGDASAGLSFIGSKHDPIDVRDFDYSSEQEDEIARNRMLQRYYFPEPRTQLGLVLGNYASSMIDISDGLWADCEHLAKASSRCIRLNLESLPVSPHLNQFIGASHERISLALTGGDDYELLFTISPENHRELSTLNDLGHDIKPIGQVESGSGVYLNGPDVLLDKLKGMPKGYMHFD